MLYIGSPGVLPSSNSGDLKIEPVEPARETVTQWFSHPAICFVGAHTGCSCGFPSVIAEVAVDYYEGMPFSSDDRDADLRSVRALLTLLHESASHGATIELYPVADGDEALPPKGRIDWKLSTLDPDRFFFNERFMHVVRIP